MLLQIIKNYNTKVAVAIMKISSFRFSSRAQVLLSGERFCSFNIHVRLAAVDA